MSTPTYERKIKDDATTKTLDAVVKARQLAVHTLKICSNENYFKIEYRRAIVDDLMETAKNIYCCADSANNIFVNDDPTKWIQRKKLQEESAIWCNRLLSLIGISRELFHLKSSKVDYWIGLTSDTRKLIHAWRESDRKRYGHLENSI